MALNVNITERLIFRHPINKINYGFRIKMIYPSNFVKYLGIAIDHILISVFMLIISPNSLGLYLC